MKNFETRTNLLTHQQAAVNKSLPSRLNALFMDAGTGKSRTVIELAKHRHAKIDKVVWFCPVSLKLTVLGEIMKHTRCVRSDVCVFDDVITEQTIPDAMWYIVGIESMSSSARVILSAKQLITEKTMVILDESTYNKNHYAKRTMRITAFSARSRYRAILTGTPISNGVEDLFAQFYFLSPKILGYSSFYSFAANHLEYSDKYPDRVVRAHNTEWLAAKIKPYTYQVTKDECLSLPGKQYVTSYFEMTDEQRQDYEETKDYYLGMLDRYEFNSYTIFLMFNALQQIVSGFRVRKRKGLLVYNHRRLETLMQSIQEELHNEKIVIWAKYQYDVESIANSLREAYGDGSVALYYGKITAPKRKLEEDRFRDKARFFLATSGTGGHGLTLTESSTVKVYNRNFKYADNQQMEDRTYRIGQNNIVVYEDIHCASSIDDRIWSSIVNKGNVLDDFRQEVDKVKKEGLKELIRSL